MVSWIKSGVTSSISSGLVDTAIQYKNMAKTENLTFNTTELFNSMAGVFMSGFSIQYLGNVTESGQVLYNKESSKYKGPVFNVQNANTKGLGLTNEQWQIIGDSDTTPIRVHSNYNVNTNQEVNMASGGCPMYDYEQADNFAAFLERSGVEPGDTINGYIKENFEP